jgi:hypothetical protein
MKQIFLIIALTALTVIGANAQDLMVKRNGSELNVKVIEVSETEVKYKLSGDDSGPTRSISTSELVRIVYENKSVDTFGGVNTPAPTTVYPGDNRNSRDSQPRIPDAYYNNGGYDGDPDYRKGYAGIGLGLSSLLEEYNNVDGSGLQFNVNFGYLFKQHIGITASFMLTSHKIPNADYKANIGLRGGFVGPLISFQNSSMKVEYDIRPTLGLVSWKLNAESASVKGDDMAVALGVGGSVRFNVSNLISLTGNLDTYLHNKFDDNTDSLSSIGVTVGINFRF